jgi:hypothetical protein
MPLDCPRTSGGAPTLHEHEVDAVGGRLRTDIQAERDANAPVHEQPER